MAVIGTSRQVVELPGQRPPGPSGPLQRWAISRALRRANVLAWSGNWLDILDESSPTPHSYTRQKMR